MKNNTVFKELFYNINFNKKINNKKQFYLINGF